LKAKEGKKKDCEESKAGTRRMGHRHIYKQFQQAAETCTTQQQQQYITHLPTPPNSHTNPRNLLFTNSYSIQEPINSKTISIIQ